MRARPLGWAMLVMVTLVGTAAGCAKDAGESAQIGAESELQTSTTPAPPEEPVEPAGTLRVGASIGLITFDPHLSQGATQSVFLEPVFEPLISRDSDGELVAGLAKEFGYVDDTALVFELELREGVTFHDGTAFDADVAVANLERARTSEGPRNGEFAIIESVAAVDADTVRITLNSPSPTFVFSLSSPLGMMMSPASMAGDAAAPVGTGPWRYDAEGSAVGQKHVFVRYPDYWDPDVVGVEEIEVIELTDEAARLNALKTGQIDVANITTTQVEDARGSGLTLVTSPDAWWGFILMDRAGTRVPELGDVRVRRAMNHALDRDAIVDAIAFGLGDPTPQYRPEGSLGYSPVAEDHYPYDPALARTLLDEAGVEGFSFSVPILPALSTWAQAVQSYLLDVGIDMQLEVVAPGTLGAEGRGGDWPASAIIVGAAHPSTDALIYISPEAPFNPYGSTHEEAIALLDAAAAEPDPDVQADQYATVSELLTEDAWFLITHYGVAVTAAADHVSGVALVPGESYFAYRGVRVDS